MSPSLKLSLGRTFLPRLSTNLAVAVKQPRSSCGQHQCERLLQRRHQSHHAGTMSAWQIHEYGNVDQLSLSQSARHATIRSPREILVKVHAASVNPIDVRMMGGYGRAILNKWRKLEDTLNAGTEFPLTLGRDFSGTIVDVGQKVTKFKVGDEVWGAIGAFRPGTHAEYTITSQREISKKPSNLSHVEAASIPYVAATTWAALHTVGQLQPRRGQRVLILGGSGGIGTFAIQLCKCWGVDVTTTCSSDAVNLVSSLGADMVLDYTASSIWDQLGRVERFDFILDGLGGVVTEKAARYLKPWKNARLVTLNFPLLRNSDEIGLLPGLIKSAVTAGVTTLKGIQTGTSVRWAAFDPNAAALDTVRGLVEQHKIRPIIQQVFPFSDASSAYKQVSDGHLRGKIVIDLQSSNTTQE